MVLLIVVNVSHHCRPVRELKAVKERLPLARLPSAAESNCSFKDILENRNSFESRLTPHPDSSHHIGLILIMVIDFNELEHLENGARINPRL